MNRGTKATKKRGDFTPSEAVNVRTALKFLRKQLGTWVLVAETLGYAYHTITDMAYGYTQASASVAIRIAKLANVPIDDVINGRYPAPGTCPHCGHHDPDHDPHKEARKP